MCSQTSISPTTDDRVPDESIFYRVFIPGHCKGRSLSSAYNKHKLIIPITRLNQATSNPQRIMLKQKSSVLPSPVDDIELIWSFCCHCGELMGSWVGAKCLTETCVHVYCSQCPKEVLGDALHIRPAKQESRAELGNVSPTKMTVGPPTVYIEGMSMKYDHGDADTRQK
jgi:hypothetical protein